MAYLRNTLLAVAFAGVVVTGCGDDDDGAADTTTTEAVESTTTAAPAEGDSGDAPADADILASAFQFTTADVTVGAGDEVTFTHDDGTVHTVTAREFEFDTGDVGEGEVGTFAAPDTAGSYEFFCVYHPAMVGTLTVE